MTPARAKSDSASHALNVPTRLFGPLAIPLEACYEFSLGLPGFPGLRIFALLGASPPGLHWLQSVEDPTLAFLLIDPDRVVTEFDRTSVRANPGDLLLAIVTLPKADGTPATANLQAPLVFNPRDQKARQCILERSPWGFQHPIPLGCLTGSSSSSPATR